MGNKSLVLLCSYHHKNTEKVAKIIAEILDAQIKMPQETSPEEISNYGLIGFGSGIYSSRHHELLLDFADKLPHVTNKNVFIFSTYGAPGFVVNKDFVSKNHLQLREKLLAKGYTVIGEFGCAGFNTNSFLKSFGGINRGRPDSEDLMKAEAFARKLIKGGL
jgi:flavodoxin